MVSVKVRKVGNAQGVILPKEALNRLKVKNGDTLFLVETPDGYTITAYDPEFQKQLAVAEEGMRQYRNALHELAK